MFDQVTYSRLTELLNGSDAQLVEVLPEEEYRQAHLPGAINIPLKALDARSAARLRKDHALVVYCQDTQ